MATDDTTAEWAFRGLVTVLGFLGWWVWTKIVTAVEMVTKDVRKLDSNFSDFKLEAEKRYAKQEHVSEQFGKLNDTMNTLQNAINTNTNMTGIIMEKISTITEKLNNKH